MTAANKTVVERFYQKLWNERQLNLADELIAADCVTHQLRSGEEVTGAARGPEEIKQHIRQWLAGFPDLRFAVEDIICDGDLVVSRSVMKGTHTGSWLGLDPSGKEVSVRMMVIQRIAEGRIAEDWVLVESLGLWQQLGLLPATEEILPKS